ncbi:coiled-coil domain-containing protein 43 [Ceratitis capitata]|uniref:Coiled-coil domain-containing protein 43 n=1 Tax=Ceratitis capitata TaxID=7213 RepID=W8C8I8_CERCA|nr:coiled-coil domain-containing protein 43 [Ceratitis capitata]
MQKSTHPIEFKLWLQEKLKELNTDSDIFGSYIMGILDTDETTDEKREGLNDILSEIITDDLDSVITLILEKWEEAHPKEEDKKLVHIDVNEQLAKLLEAQKLRTTVKEREYTEEEKRIREQILAQYSQTEIEDEDAYDSEEEPDGSIAATSLTGIERNTNAQDVLALQKEKREQARLGSAAKKQKDKEDRERQKQLREEKKEKRKTVKGERRR